MIRQAEQPRRSGVEAAYRTTLFVPGDRASRIGNAVACGADAVAVDLEDAVAESVKAEARETAVATLLGLDTPGVSVMVRVNGIRTPHVRDDVAALTPLLSRLAAVILPMAESADDVAELSVLLSRAEAEAGVEVGRTRVLATTETASGVLAAREIAGASSRVLTLLFGSADLSNELGVEPTAEGAELATARSTVVLAAASARLPKPLDGPYLVLDDDEGLETSTRTARRLGFGGKAVIHPSQLPTVARAFAPTPEELAWARQVDEAFTEAEREGRSAVRLADGTFIDYPIAYRARTLLGATTPEGGAR